MGKTLIILTAILVVVLASAYTVIPVSLKATYSNTGGLTQPMVVKEGTAYVSFENITTLGVQRSGNSVRVLLSTSKKANLKSARISIKPPFSGNVYWKLELPCDSPAKVYTQEGRYFFDIDGLDGCGESGIILTFTFDKVPIEVGVSATVRNGLRLYKAEWSFLIENS